MSVQDEQLLLLLELDGWLLATTMLIFHFFFLLLNLSLVIGADGGVQEA